MNPPRTCDPLLPNCWVLTSLGKAATITRKAAQDRKPAKVRASKIDTFYTVASSIILLSWLFFRFPHSARDCNFFVLKQKAVTSSHARTNDRSEFAKVVSRAPPIRERVTRCQETADDSRNSYTCAGCAQTPVAPIPSSLLARKLRTCDELDTYRPLGHSHRRETLPRPDDRRILENKYSSKERKETKGEDS